MSFDATTSLQLMATGTRLCAAVIAGLDEVAFAGPSLLPDWTRKHVVAHLVGNAQALGRLLHWATTGEPTPMYASPEQRNADIEAGATRSGAELAAWFQSSADALDGSVTTMTTHAWNAEVVTAQGRTVPASDLPWMRSRELFVHAVDLGTSVSFATLPRTFLETLHAEIHTKRAAAGEQLGELMGTLADVTAYLAGRGTSGVTTVDGAPAPALSAWL